MKIERINDNQIRCTLTVADLADRHMHISELAYGSDKAKKLFHDMMQQAAYELGFEAEDIPLMIEAIPLSGGSLILNITKIEYPEELDTRYSDFTDFGRNGSDYSGSADLPMPEGADDILELFRKIGAAAASLYSSEQTADKDLTKDSSNSFVPLKDTAPTVTPKPDGSLTSEITSEIHSQADSKSKSEVKSAPEYPTDIVKLFSFQDMKNIIRLAHVLERAYHGDNSLFLDTAEKTYYLILHKSDHSPSEFNKVCNILSEYALQNKYIESAEAYFNEHFKCVASHDALQRFANI